MKVQETLGLVVIGYRSDEVWKPFFNSIQSSTTRPAAIVVVENSPTVSPTLERFPDLPITVVHRSDNPGYGTAANAGVAALSQDIAHIVICNPDVTLHPEALARLLSAWKQTCTQERWDPDFSPQGVRSTRLPEQSRG